MNDERSPTIARAAGAGRSDATVGPPAVTARLPLPRLTLRVGVTGHRLNKLPVEAHDAIRATLRTTLHLIEAALTGFQTSPEARCYAAGPPVVRIVSALAEGSDRLAVEEAPESWRLTAILPMPAGEYERDFLAEGGTESASLTHFRRLLASAETVTELAASGQHAARSGDGRNRLYAALGSYLVRQVDLLIAIWDGHPAEGPGGTAGVVAEAVALGVAVVWITPGEGPAEPRILTGFAGGALARPETAALHAPGLGPVLRNRLGLGSAPVRHDHGHDGHDAKGHDSQAEASPPQAPAFLEEPWPKPLRFALAFPALRALSGSGWRWPNAPAPLPGRLREPDPLLQAAGLLPASAGDPDPLPDVTSVLRPRMVWADELAIRHSELYRSAYVTVFALAGLSVPVGLCYLFAQDQSTILNVKLCFVLAELAIILTVVGLVRRGVRQHWHGSWIETRALAELLRAARPLAAVGLTADLLDVSRPSEGGQAKFSLWYARATARELRPPHGALDEDYLRRVLASTLTTDVIDQYTYHRANAERMRRINHFLHGWGTRCFWATIAFLSLYLLVYVADWFVTPSHAAGPATASGGGGLHGLLHDVVKPLVSVTAASFPAIGAALAGINAQGAFRDTELRSAATRDALAELRAQFEQVLKTDPGHVTLAATSELLLATGREMLDDVQSWQQAYAGRVLMLPA